MKTKKEEVGHKFGDWTVVDDTAVKKGKYSHPYLLCVCKCGVKKVVSRQNLRRKSSVKCRTCSNIGIVTTHGLTNTLLYQIWSAIKQRVGNPKNPSYCNYGGRGVGICKDWKDNFQSFYDWCMDNGYKKGLEIDRINNNGDYEPLNCRFITRKDNNKNKRSNRLLTAFGETKCLVDWADDIRCLVKKGTLSRRINTMKWTHEKSITTPNLKPRKKK